MLKTFQGLRMWGLEQHFVTVIEHLRQKHKGKVYFVSWFQKVQSLAPGPVGLVTKVAQSVVAKTESWLPHSSLEGQEWDGPAPNIPLSACPQWTLIPDLGY